MLLILLLHWFLLRWLPSYAGPDDPPAHARARGAAMLASLTVATVPFLIVWARAATTDMILTLFISITLLAMLHADLVAAAGAERKTVNKWYLLAACTAALGFLTKGPVGVIIPGLVWLCYHSVQRSLLRELRRVPWLPVLAIFVLISAPWYVATYIVDGPAFLKHFFFRENLARFTSVMERHGTDTQLKGLAMCGQYALGLLMYWPIALALLFPISPFVLHEAFAPFAGNSSLRKKETLTRIRRFAWCWVLAVIVLFSLSRTQLPSYIQSIIAGAGLLFAVHILGRGIPRPAAVFVPGQQETKPDRAVDWGTLCELVLLVAIVTALVYFLSLSLLHSNFRMVQWVPPAPIPHGQAVTAATVLGISGGLFVLGAGIAWALKRPMAFIGWVWLSWTVVIAVLALGVGELAVQSNYALMVQAGESIRALPKEIPVLAYFPSAPETLVYYARRPIVLCSLEHKEYISRLTILLHDNNRVFVVTDADGLALAKNLYTVSLLRQFGTSIFILYATDQQKGEEIGIHERTLNDMHSHI